jgi:hypothetical protein
MTKQINDFQPLSSSLKKGIPILGLLLQSPNGNKFFTTEVLCTPILPVGERIGMKEFLLKERKVKKLPHSHKNQLILRLHINRKNMIRQSGKLHKRKELVSERVIFLQNYDSKRRESIGSS